MTLIRITPNIEKAKSIMKMSKSTLVMIKDIDRNRFPSNIIKEYYDVIRELVGVIMLLDGYKIIGESAHKDAFEYLKKNYSKHFKMQQLMFMDSLRVLRNDISYDGFFIETNYLDRTEKEIATIITILDKLVSERIKE